MNRPTPAHTKLLLCVWHRFTLWRPPANVAAQIRHRWAEMRFVHLPTSRHIEDELPNTDILIGYSGDTIGKGMDIPR